MPDTDESMQRAIAVLTAALAEGAALAQQVANEIIDEHGINQLVTDLIHAGCGLVQIVAVSREVSNGDVLQLLGQSFA